MNKANGGDGIPAELVKILKGDAVKVLHSICQQIWKAQQWPQDQKRSVFIPVAKKGNAKECSNSCIILLISHASKVMFVLFLCLVTQLCPTLCYPMGCNPACSSVHGIFQARVLEWGAIAFSVSIPTSPLTWPC